MWNRKRTLGILSAVALMLLALVGGVVYFLSSPDFAEFAADYLVERIEDRTGASVTLDRLDADIQTLRFNLEGLVLRGEEDPGGRPLVSVARIEADLSWRGLFQRSLDLTRLSVTRPEVFIEFREDGTSNVPTPPPSTAESSTFGFSIDELNVTDGSLAIDERRMEVDFSLAGLDGEFAYSDATAVLSGHVEYDGSFVQAGRSVVPYALTADFDYTRGTLLLETARFRSGGSDLSVQGRIDEVLARRAGQLAYVGNLDLELLDSVLPDEDIQGVLDVTGDLEFSPGRLTTVGRVQSPSVTVGQWSAENLVSTVEYAFPEQSLRAEGLEANVFAGRVGGVAEISFSSQAPPHFELDLEYEGIETAAVRSLYPWDPQYVVTSLAAGTISGWFEGRFEQFDFMGDVTFEPVSGESVPGVLVLPIRGTSLYRATPGSLEVSELGVEIGSTEIRADGLVDPEALDLEFAIESQAFQDFEFLLGFANGAGYVDGVVRGPIDNPEVSANFNVSNYIYNDRAIDRIDGRAVVNLAGVELEDVYVVRGDSEVRIWGFTDYGFDRPDLEIQLVRLIPSDLPEIGTYTADGVVSGEVSLDSFDPLRLTARLESAAFTYEGYPLGQVEARVSIGPDAWEFTDVVARREAVSLGGEFQFEPATQALAGSLVLSGYEIENLEALGVPAGISGRVRSASFELGGTVSLPQVEGQAVFDSFEVYGHPLPDVALLVETEGRRARVQVDAGSGLGLAGEIDTSFGSGYPFQGSAQFVDFVLASPVAGLSAGSVRVSGDASFGGQLQDLETFQGIAEVRALTARVANRTLNVSEPFTVRFDTDRVELSSIELSGEGTSLTMEGSVAVSSAAATDGYPFQGRARFGEFAPGELVGMASDTLVLTGNMSFDGRLRDLRSLRGSGEINALTLLVGERTLSVSEPFMVDFDAQQVRISRVRLSGTVTALTVEGTLGISGEIPLDLSVQGAIDLSLLAGTYEGLDPRGTVVVDGRIGGNAADPELVGVATLDDVSLAHEGFFLSLSSLSGAMFFEENRVNLTGVTASAGGGDVALRGTFGVDGASVSDLDIRLDATNVRIRTPDGIRTVLNGALALGGTPEAPTLDGNIQIMDFSFDGDFNAFLALFDDDGLADIEDEGLLDRLTLSIHVEGDRNIRIDNELTSVQARVDVDIAGTLAQPAMTGHMETTSGNLNLQGTRYRITRGNVDFIDPLGVLPLIDVQAEADLRDYRIILIISGRGNDIRLDMRSDPPLSQLEIVTLMAGGRTREELAASGPDGGLVPTSEQLFTGGAATILSDLLQERVGSRLGLLGRVRVDPFLVGAENDPVARVTVSEQITRDLAITYSQDLSSNRQQIILIEYFLNNDTSFIASRDETGALGVDVRLRKRFR